MPFFIREAGELVAELKKYSPAQLQQLMGINSKLALLNAERFGMWNKNQIGQGFRHLLPRQLFLSGI